MYNNYDIETLDDNIDNLNRIKTTRMNARNDNIETMDEENVDDYIDNIERGNEKIYDLTNDIKVNDYMADAGAPINPDAELLDDIDLELLKKKTRIGEPLILN